MNCTNTWRNRTQVEGMTVPLYERRLRRSHSTVNPNSYVTRAPQAYPTHQVNPYTTYQVGQLDPRPAGNPHRSPHPSVNLYGRARRSVAKACRPYPIDANPAGDNQRPDPTGSDDWKTSEPIATGERHVVW